MVLMSRLTLRSCPPPPLPGGCGPESLFGRARLRARVWMCALELDRTLADGGRPEASAELGLRAELLIGRRSRAALATALLDAVDAASCPAGPPVGSPLAWAGVLDAAGPLVALARELRRHEAPAVRGVALASWLVCDCAGSPLYDARARVSVREVAREARSALVAG